MSDSLKYVTVLYFGWKNGTKNRISENYNSLHDLIKRFIVIIQYLYFSTRAYG
jgi:hypothetical protein